MDQVLTSAGAVIDKLGGDKHVAQMFDVSPKAANNWRCFNRFPARTYPTIAEALEEMNCAAPRDLWSFDRAKRSAK